MPSKWRQIAEAAPEQQPEKDLQGQISKWAQMAQEYDAQMKLQEQAQQAEQAPPQNLDWGQVALGAAKNLPRSTYEFGRDVLTPLLSPIETAKTLANLALGIVEKVPGARHITPGPTYDIEGQEGSRSEIVDAVLDYFQDAYGSVQGFKKAMSEDPVGVTTDLSSVLTGGGGALKAAGKVTKLKSVEKLGEAAAKAGLQFEPYNIAKLPVRSIKPFLDKIPKISPSELYESAAKWRTTLTKNERQKITKTALDKQIMPTYAGLDRLNDRINVLNEKIMGLIDQAQATGAQIPIKSLFSDFNKLRADARLTGKPLQAKKAINKIQREIILANRVPGQKKLRKLTPQEAQKLKQNIYKEIQSYYSSVVNSPISVKAQKAIARQAKIAIEELVPVIKNVNRAEGDLLALKKEIDRAATRIGNRDILSLGTTAKAAGGGVVAGGPGLAAGLALGMLDSQPVIKARLALLLHRMQQRGMRVRITPTVARLFAAEIGNIENIQESGE